MIDSLGYKEELPTKLARYVVVYSELGVNETFPYLIVDTKQCVAEVAVATLDAARRRTAALNGFA